MAKKEINSEREQRLRDRALSLSASKFEVRKVEEELKKLKTELNNKLDSFYTSIQLNNTDPNNQDV